MPSLLLSEPGQIDDLPPAGANFPRVLVPVDFSVCTLETLHYAQNLAVSRARAAAWAAGGARYRYAALRFF